MLTIKQGFPQPEEIVLCTVKKVQPHAVTVLLDEYQKMGLIHISEISPGRIRNIRDFVKEDKVVVCKVLRVDREKGYIDLSLRRVNERLKRNKVNEIKQEQMAEKILEFVAKKHSTTLEKLYAQVKDKIFAKFDSLYECFEAVVEEDLSLSKLGIEAKIAAELEEHIRHRIKPAKVKIGGELKISTYSSTGVEDIKSALDAALKSSEHLLIRYLGAGKYGVEVDHSNFKDAEVILKDVVESIQKSFTNDSTASVLFERKELKA